MLQQHQQQQQQTIIAPPIMIQSQILQRIREQQPVPDMDTHLFLSTIQAMEPLLATHQQHIPIVFFHSAHDHPMNTAGSSDNVPQSANMFPYLQMIRNSKKDNCCCSICGHESAWIVISRHDIVEQETDKTHSPPSQHHARNPPTAAQSHAHLVVIASIDDLVIHCRGSWHVFCPWHRDDNNHANVPYSPPHGPIVAAHDVIIMGPCRKHTFCISCMHRLVDQMHCYHCAYPHDKQPCTATYRPHHLLALGLSRDTYTHYVRHHWPNYEVIPCAHCKEQLFVHKSWIRASREQARHYTTWTHSAFTPSTVPTDHTTTFDTVTTTANIRCDGPSGRMHHYHPTLGTCMIPCPTCNHRTCYDCMHTLVESNHVHPQKVASLTSAAISPSNHHTNTIGHLGQVRSSTAANLSHREPIGGNGTIVPHKAHLMWSNVTRGDHRARCLHCSTFDDRNDPWAWNPYFHRPPPPTSHTNNMTTAVPWEEDALPWRHLLRNKHLTVDWVWQSMMHIIQTYVQTGHVPARCAMCHQGLYKTCDCNALHHCRIETCYACGYTTAQGMQIPASHWSHSNEEQSWERSYDHRGHHHFDVMDRDGFDSAHHRICDSTDVHLGCPRYDHDAYWNHVEQCHFLCRQSTCYDDQHECTQPEHEMGIRAMHAVRLFLHLRAMIDSLPDTLYVAIRQRWYQMYGGGNDKQIKYRVSNKDMIDAQIAHPGDHASVLFASIVPTKITGTDHDVVVQNTLAETTSCSLPPLPELIRQRTSVLFSRRYS